MTKNDGDCDGVEQEVRIHYVRLIQSFSVVPFLPITIFCLARI